MASPTKDEIIQFSIEIEKISREKELNYIDSIIHYCTTTGIEVESVSKLVGTQLKSKIAIQASELNLIKKTGVRKLPL